MSSLKFSMIFVFLFSLSSSLFTFTIAQSANPSPNYLNNVCSNNTFTRNSTYQSNLNRVLSSLASKANGSDGFSNATAGQNPNRVYGLFQCRSDLNTSTCQNCVVKASTEVTQRCPTQKGNIIWYDECLLHYSDSNIFSTVTTNPSRSLKNSNIPTDPTRFEELVLDLMSEATTLAANNTKRYATRERNFTTSETIYTFVQCTQDLSSDDCSRCLRQNTANLPNETIGGRTYYPSCYCMFELYNFYTHNASPPPAPTTLSPPSPVTRPTGKRRISTSVIIAIVAPITVSAVLFVAGYCFLTRRARKKYNSLPGKIGMETLERWNTNEDPATRPTMATVVLMLNSYSVTLALPQQPAFFYGARTDLGKQLTIGTDSDHATDPNYLFHYCSDKNFTRNSTFQSNVNLVLSSLASNSNGSDGFSNATAGQDPNRVYGLFQCRSDLPTSTCQDCVVFASTDAVQRCPIQKGAIIWYDECLVHYSDTYIFSTVESNPSIRLWNTMNATDPTRFDELVLSLMNEARTLAVNNPKRFATKKGDSTTSQTIYTLVQCTRDLSSDDCSRCLVQNTANLPKGVIGGRTLYPSCYCMFELYPFYNDNSTASPPPTPTVPSPPSPVTRPAGKRRISSSVIIAIVVPITVAAVLFVAGYCFLTRRARKKYNYVPDKIAGNDITTVESLQFDFGTIQAATNGFSTNNKLGEGGFVKSDVFSFGVLVLEIITGKKTTNFYQTDGAEDLLNYAWKHWRDGTPMQLLDSTLTDSYSRNEVIRCIHIGLLCVQEDPAVRPTMATVVLMLNSYSVTLALPQQPAFFYGNRTDLGKQFAIGTNSDQSKSKSVPWSVDDSSITEVYPR
ncbi:hypothetical protein EZV62_026425 [Acer yangbiense]|uniref:Gnk2-homologous domain-containing protein n=1 Tax=Acer yangbiense TaxID=1000413 RepID=A0A5C7GQQ1_9ROSI|nr:hypothetical protein EZV62_026425 [Acer yangbiense]